MNRNDTLFSVFCVMLTLSFKYLAVWKFNPDTSMCAGNIAVILLDFSVMKYNTWLFLGKNLRIILKALRCVWPYTNVSSPSAPQSHLPFAVVGSTEEVKIGNKMVKARQYPWGTVQGKPRSHPAQEMRARSLSSELLQRLPPLVFLLGSNSCCILADSQLYNLI